MTWQICLQNWLSPEMRKICLSQYIKRTLFLFLRELVGKFKIKVRFVHPFCLHLEIVNRLRERRRRRKEVRGEKKMRQVKMGEKSCSQSREEEVGQGLSSQIWNYFQMFATNWMQTSSSIFLLLLIKSTVVLFLYMYILNMGINVYSGKRLVMDQLSQEMWNDWGNCGNTVLPLRPWVLITFNSRLTINELIPSILLIIIAIFNRYNRFVSG